MVAQDALFMVLAGVVRVSEDVKVLQGSECKHYGD
jgi:hypothetical protein